MHCVFKKALIASCAITSLCALLSSCSTESPIATGTSLQKSAAANSGTGAVRIINPPDSAFITVSIYQPLNGAIVFRGDPVTIAASAWAIDSQSHITRVVFYKNGVRLGVDYTAPYEFLWRDTTRGVFTLLAKAFDSKGDSGISAPVIITRQDGFIVLSAPLDSQIVPLGDSVVILAKAAGTQFHTIKNVKFYRNTTLMTTMTAPPYRYVWRNPAVGVYRITAIAVDTKGMLDTSNAATIYIKKIPPVVSIGEPANNSMVKAGSTITISAWAYTPDSGGSISYVKIYRNGRLLTTDYSSPYTYTWTNAALGVYALTAVASNSHGVLGYSDTVKVSVVSKIPAIAITAPASGDTFAPNTPVTVQTSLTDFGSVAYVRFLVDSMGYAFVDSIAPYTAEIGLAPGYHTISAVAVVAPGVEYSAIPVYIIVQEYQAPSVSITSPKDSSSFSSPQSITIQATASSANGSIRQVQFFRDSLFLGADSTSPYAYTWVRPPKGSYELRATATDSYGAVGTSQRVLVTIR